jgi:hypothetical protein
VNERRPEVADVLASFAGRYRASFSPGAEQKRVLHELPLCRTAALGGHKLECDRCGHQEISYNSCRNRHCPKCRASARAAWLAEREADLLDVPYSHVVFTLPDEISALALQNRRLCYGLLFRAAARTLRTIAADPAHLGAEVGFLAVLHTWSQTLLHHPHVHCVVPAGGIGPDGKSWVPCRAGFFLPVRVLSRLFRRLYLADLQKAFGEGELALHGRLASLREPRAFARWIGALRAKEWVVYAKPPFGGPVQVLKYLARYTHRVAISNSRLVAIDGEHVRFLWKDRAHGGRSRCMRVSGVEFVRRFLLHVLPKGFVRIRHFGFLSNRAREKKLALARRLIADRAGDPQAHAQDAPRAAVVVEAYRAADDGCPCCEQGRMRPAGAIEPSRPQAPDTS